LSKVKPILIIRPHDKSTSFLERIKNHLVNEFEDRSHYFNVKLNDQSHEQCVERIKQHSENGIIIFLGHGRSDALLGSRGDLYENYDFVSPEARDEEPESYYFNGNFISAGNMDLFENKKVFCLACRSNEIGEVAINSGAKAFIGFGDIPTSLEEFQIKGGEANSTMVSTMKTEVNRIVKVSLAYCIKKDLSFEDLMGMITYLTNQRIADILTHYTWFKERHALADHLYYFKKEARIFGDKNIRLLS